MNPSLGTTLKAYRLGFRLCKQHGAMIRISTVGPRTFIELSPPDQKIPSRLPVKAPTYRCWWEGEPFLHLIEWLKPIRRVKKYIAVEVDDNGNVLRSLS